MTEALRSSFTTLKDQQWLQTGVAQLNEIMIGKKELEILTYDVLEFVTSYTNCYQGAFYLRVDEDVLQLAAGIAINKNGKR